MCAPEQYLVIEAVADLPRQLPKIYHRLIRAA
jgi:nitric oxide reductase activation protein